MGEDEMNHEKIQQQLSEWLDGELDAPASAELSRHIDSCSSCKGEVFRLRRLGEALFQAPAAADPRSTGAFVARVMARVEAESVSPWERFAALFLAPAFGLALAGLLISISLPRVDPDAPLGVAVSVDADSVLGMAP
jgi:anti-sigma factor RsiW